MRDSCNRLAAFYRRHRFLCAALAIIIGAYVIVRVFFTPPILRDVYFGNAYYDRNGNLLRMTLSADEKYRVYTPPNQISPAIQSAIVLYEDKYFKYHPGVNPVSLIRAIAGYVKRTPHPAGASTITMQVARLKYNINTKTPGGKLKQIAAAIYIDAFHSKSEILNAYLNLAPFGGNIEGIGAASLIFFHKRASDISTIESITLATIPQNPTKRNISTKSGLGNIMAMRADLVRRWIESHPNDTGLATLAQMPLAVYGISDLPFDAPHFTDRQIARNQNFWKNPYPPRSEIFTTLDIELQRKLTRTLRNEINKKKSMGVENAAAVLINYKTMDVLAYIGSADYFDKSILGENDGVNAKRSPGSTLKPLIYAAAVDRGLIHSMTLLKDAKINFGVYAPENADSEFYGPVLAYRALTHSRNIPAINLVREIGATNFYNLLTQSGVSGLRPPSHYGISIALGGAELAMFELANIYAMIANLGRRYDLRTTLTDNRGDGTQLLSPEAFFIVIDMLGRQSVASRDIPFARRDTPTLRHFWKTGTSSSFRDAWTAGIFGDFVLIVWVGNFNGAPNNAFSGAKTAAPIYFALSRAVADHYAAHGKKIENNNFYRPELNIAEISMCDTVGGLAGAHCPHAVSAYFIPGVSPIETSAVYRAVPIDRKTGLRACGPDFSDTYMDVFEFWDAEFLDMFRRAGISRKTPPNFNENCNLDDMAAMHTPPRITSPIDGTRIVITSGDDVERVSFRAIADMENVNIFWVLDGVPIGASRAGDVFTHDVAIGEHNIRAIDEMGTVAESEFMVIK